MRNAGRLFTPPLPSANATRQTAHGLPAFDRPWQERLLQVLLCNTLEDTFYAAKRDMLEETKAVHEHAITTDIAFYAMALAYARERGLMRTQPIYGLALLATRSDLDVWSDLDASTWFEEVFPKVIKTPNDLIDFHGIIRSLKGGKDGGRRIKRVAGKWLAEHMGEYWAIKYGGTRDGAFALRDLLRIYHPRPGEKDALFKWIAKGEIADITMKLIAMAKEGETWHKAKPRDVSEAPLLQVAAFEALKRATTPEEKARLITVGRLPHEVATAFAGKDPIVWRAIARQLPGLALVRNLATLERVGLFNEKETRKLVCDKLESPELAKAKIFPFVLTQAMDHVSNNEVKDALRVGVETLLSSAEGLPGKVLVALDVSTSMSGNGIREAALFAVATARRTPGSKMITFNREPRDFPISRVDSVLTQAQSIRPNGGTDQGAIVRWLQATGERFDAIVVVTDEEQESGRPFVDCVAEWRGTKLGKGTKVCVANMVAGARRLLPPAKDNSMVFGLTEQSVQFMARALTGWGSFVDEVREHSLEESVEK